MTASKTIISKSDITSRLLKKKLFPQQNLTIQCHHISGLLFRDLLDLYLTFSGAKQWEWINSKGHSQPRQSLTQILFNLFRDLQSWPVSYLKKARETEKLFKSNKICQNFKEQSPGLYLRTDHWFGTTSGGAFAHLMGVIRAFRSLKYQIQVVSSGPIPGIDGDEDFYLCEPAIKSGRNIPNMAELNYNDQLKLFLEKNWPQWNPSFIYQRYSLLNYAGVYLRQKYGVPLICEYNGSLPWKIRHWQGRPLLHEKLALRIELLNMHAADVVVVVSQALAEELIKRGISPEKILINPNGVDTEMYSPDVDGSEIRKKYRLTGKTVIGFIGSFAEYHGVEILVEAFRKLFKEFPEYKGQAGLLLIGDGAAFETVKKNINEYDLSDDCILTGSVPQMEGPVYLSACDILTSPFLPNSDGTPFFGSPIKLFEYMAMGKAIVSTDLGQIPDILKHEQTGWLVKPGDIEALKNAIKILVDDKNQRERLGKAARKEAIAKYTWKQHTMKIIDKLGEVSG